MAVNLTVNGVIYPFPQTGDEQWGDIVTNWATGVTNGMLQKSGGLFTLTAEVDFGANHGLKSLYYKSRSANVASVGQIRLANTDAISFRNAGNSGNLDLKPGSSDAVVQYNSIDLVNLSTAQTLSNKIQGSDLLPSAHNTLDVGSNAVRWKDGYFQGNVTIAGSLSAGSVTFTDLTTVNLTATGNTIIGNADTDTLDIDADIISNLRPDATNTYDIGSSSNRWRDIYVARDGYINRVLLGNGTVGAPALAFESDTPLGIYRDSGSSFQLVAGGAVKMQVTLTQLTPYVPVRGAAGTVAEPTFSFNGDSDTGIYNDGINSLAIVTAGSEIVRFRSGRVELIDGSAASPVLSFSGDQNTGFYRIGADQVGLSLGGVLQVDVSTGRFQTAMVHRTISGSAASPSYSFTSGTGTGLWLTGTNLAVSTGGTQRLEVKSSGLQVLNSGIIEVPTTATALAPAYTFTGDLDTGIYQNGANRIAFSTGGAFAGEFVSQTFRMADGVAATPSYSFVADPDTGIYRSAESTFHLVASGSAKLQVGSDGVTVQTNVLKLPNGTAAVPTLTFTSDVDTGIYNIAANTMGFSTGGVVRGRFAATGQFVVGDQPVSTIGVLQVFQSSDTDEGGFGILRAGGATNSYRIFIDGSNVANITRGNVIMSTIANAGDMSFGPSTADRSHTINAASVSRVSATASMVEDQIKSVTLSNNIAVATSIATFAVASNKALILEYSILRNGIDETGTLIISSDGTTARIVRESTIADTGIEFTADVSGANVRLLYTSTNTGFTATFKYSVHRWNN